MRHATPRVSRRSFLAGAAALATVRAKARSSQAIEVAAEERVPSPYTLHFPQPASKWPNALPVGNGRLGAMVFGVPALERIQLNEESIWDGEPNRDRNNPKAAAALPRIRELLFSGQGEQIAQAETLAISDVLSIPRRMPCYQTLGDLHLDFSSMGLRVDTPVEDYRLQLDLDTAVVTTTFRHAGVLYRREVFSSAPDQVIVIRLTASERSKIGLRATLDRPGGCDVAPASASALAMSGRALPVNDNPGLPVKENPLGVGFFALLQAVTEGTDAKLTAPDEKRPGIEVAAADAVTLLFDCATTYRYPAENGKASGADAAVLLGNPKGMASGVIENVAPAAQRSYAELKARHIADYQRFFRRVVFELGPDPNAATPTDARVKTIKDGGEDIHLLPIYFQFGRYLLISSSRPGTLAANLQGIWNESVDPPWGSKYTVNINTEMNYWFAESANLSECHLPLFDLLHSTNSQGGVTARELYRAKGSVVHHNTDIWGDSGPIDGLGGGVWPMGANWMSLQLWKHYEFTGDRRFLKEQAYPAFRENVVFLLDYLVRDPKTGHLVTGPSCSPENAYELDGKSYNLCMGPTMDISIVRSVFARLLESADLLSGNAAVEQDSALLQRVRAAYDQLPPFQIGRDGRLQEWQVDYKDHEPGHRHISHLFGLFPEDQITVDGTPELARAARLVLDKRLAAGGGSTGWSRSWIINCMARLRDGEACYQNVLELFRQSTRPNLFDVCGLKENSPFQIDGNLGAPSGFIEMLLQSHGQTPLSTEMDAWSTEKTAPVIRLLPALPKSWPSGSFRGLRAQGGVEISMVWKEGKAVTATLRAVTAGTHSIMLPKGQRLATLNARSKTQEPTYRADGALQLKLEAGQDYTLNFTA